MHTAPAHGADDFAVGRQHHLDSTSPVGGNGVFNQDAGPFAGMHIHAANGAIVAALAASQALLSDPSRTLEHRYPHCWRCHKPVIIRATEQWFVAMDKPFAQGATLRQRAMAALDTVHWVPHWGKQRIGSMLAARPDWCLSRQRKWGVPLCVLYCDSCNTPVVDPTLIEKAAQSIEKSGAAAWYSDSVEALCGQVVCPHCGSSKMRKETDILDVWFDSGVSFAAVIEAQGLGHRDTTSIDLVLEGSDQHRGWFQSGLLCALATGKGRPIKPS